MTERQKKFADEYIKDLNATRAYMAAYPTVTKAATAGQAGSRLLKNVNVKAYVAEQLDKLHDERTADAKEILEYLTSVVRGQSLSSEIVVEGIGDGCSEARTMQKPPSEKERLKAAELLGRRFALFSDNVNLEVVVPRFEGEGDLAD